MRGVVRRGRWTRHLLLALLSGVAAHPSLALAADKPDVGPVPAWVKPTPYSLTAAAPDDKSSAVRTLLLDEQVSRLPDGMATYHATARKLETTLGLSMMPPIIFAWSPDLASVTVHYVRIRRGDQTIDLLKDGKTLSILRRENNLEYQTLDGMLTATMQPEGVQVGDVLEVAYTETETDPTLKGHVQTIVAPWRNNSAETVNFRAIWPKDHPLKWRAADLPGELKSGPQEIALKLEQPKAFEAPNGAPLRFRMGPRVEMSDFSSWAEVSSIFYPLYVEARRIAPDSPLKAEIEKIQTANADPAAQVSAALALVESKIRYVAVTLDRGGYLPASADQTWSRRYGDCKAKTVLLLALLDGLGIKAEPAVVSSGQGDGLDQRLPMPGAFDHIIVRAEVAGKVRWLDGTRMGDLSIAALPAPGFTWALPLRPSGGALERLEAAAPDKPMSELAEVIDLSAGVNARAPVHAEMVMRGDAGRYYNMFSQVRPAKDREDATKAFWLGRYNALNVKSATATFDEATGELKLVMDGQAAFGWTKRGETMRALDLRTAQLLVQQSFDHYPVYGTEDKSKPRKPTIRHEDAPFQINFPQYEQTSTRVVLPSKRPGFTLVGADVDRTVGGKAILRHAELKDGTLLVQTSIRSLLPELSLADAKAAKPALNQIAADRLLLVAPEELFSDQNRYDEIAAATPSTKEDYDLRAATFAQRRLWKEGLAAAEQAEKLGEDSPPMRGLYAELLRNNGKFPEAAAQLDKALAAPGLTALLTSALQAEYARLDLARGKKKEALERLDALLESKPTDAQLLLMRGSLRATSDQEDGAIEDYDAAIRAAPAALDAYAAKAAVLIRQKKPEAAGDAVMAMTANNPLTPDAYTRAAALYYSLGQREDSLAAADKSIIIKPNPAGYLARSLARGPTDRSLALEDIKSALKLDASVANLAAAGAQRLRLGDYDGAADAYTAAMKLTDAASLQASRMAAYEAGGHADLAAQDYAAVRAKAAKDATMLNNLCWTQATNNVALSRALSDCNAALAIKKLPAYYDSRAFVLYRLGRNAEAISAYDSALTISPKQAASLYGRGLAKLANGNPDQGKTDIQAALDVDPTIGRQFSLYGVEQPATGVRRAPTL